MCTVTSITIDEFGQIQIPLEVNQELNLQNNDWLKVSIKSDHIVMVPSRDVLDQELLDALIHEGILIDVK
ncbi:MAG: AbrB/MazE/SpoVT family DNA-binding domain-containing protein [Syntrophomonadaceae bacterium]|nr:AbrB/MazE/SpoVT family DNA-binding domain-containing protein [Syntrophomonadaceae bacterium]